MKTFIVTFDYLFEINFYSIFNGESIEDPKMIEKIIEYIKHIRDEEFWIKFEEMSYMDVKKDLKDIKISIYEVSNIYSGESAYINAWKLANGNNVEIIEDYEI